MKNTKVKTVFNLGKLIKVKRKDLGLSLRKLSNLSGVSAIQINDMENEKICPFKKTTWLKVFKSLKSGYYCSDKNLAEYIYFFKEKKLQEKIYKEFSYNVK